MNEIVISIVVLVFILMYIRIFIEKKFDEQFEVFKAISEALIQRLDSNNVHIKESYIQFRKDYLIQSKKLDIYLDCNKKLISLINEIDNSSLPKKDKKKTIKENSDKIYSNLEKDIEDLLKD